MKLGKLGSRLDWIGTELARIGLRMDDGWIESRMDFIEIECVERAEAEGELRWVLVWRRRRRTRLMP